MNEKMASESTPLIATVRVGSPPRRYPHNVVRRFCTIALASTLLVSVVVFLVTVAFDGQHHGRRPHRWTWPGCEHSRVDYEQLKEILLDVPSSEKAAEWSKYYTSGAHLAGQNYSQVCIS